MLSFIVAISTAIGNLVLGLLSYINNPKSATNRLFVLLAIIISGWAVSNYFSLTNTDSEAITLFWIRAVMFITTPMGVVLYMLSRTFPNTSLGISRRLLWIFVGYVVLTCALAWTPLMFSDVTIENGNITPSPGPAIILFALSFIGGPLVAFITLFVRLRRAVGKEKAQMKLLLAGIIVAFTLMGLTNFIFVVLLKSSSFVIFGPAFSLILLGFIFYAIVVHRFLDMTGLIMRSVTYTLMISTFAVLYSLLIFYGASLFSEDTISQSNMVLVTLTALFFTLSFNQFKRVFELLTEKLFYHKHYSSEEILHHLTKVLSSQITMPGLIAETAKVLEKELKISDAQLFNGVNTELITKRGEVKELPKVEAERYMHITHLANQRKRNGILIFDEMNENDNKRQLRELGAKAVLPIVQGNQLLGSLLLGEKVSGDVYSSRDISLIKTIGRQLSVSMQNALSFEEIKRFNETLESEVKKATHRLRSANERLKQLDKLKDEFVSLASHELRTPMTSIRNYLWMALNQEKGGKLNKKQQFYLQRSYSSTERLINLVNDILNISRIESGRMALQVDKVDMLELARSAVGEVSAKAEKENIEIVVEDKALNRDTNRESSVPEVVADRDKIDEVLINLVGNSLKFTPAKGTITIRFEYDKHYLYTSVIDTGVGIEANMLDKLFVKFGLIDNSYRGNKDPVQGTGLGLYLSKSLVEMHTGTITVESKGKDKGTTFSFSLPLFSQKVKEEIQSKQKGKPVLAALKRVK